MATYDGAEDYRVITTIESHYVSNLNNKGGGKETVRLNHRGDLFPVTGGVNSNTPAASTSSPSTPTPSTPLKIEQRQPYNPQDNLTDPKKP